MNQQQRAVVQQALEAFDVLTINDYSGYECSKHETDKINEAQAALHQLLEQPEPAPVQEPVAWHHPDCEGECIACLIERAVQAAYGAQGLAYLHRRVTTPPAQPEPVPLTDDQIETIIKNNMSLQMNLAGIRQDFEAAYIRPTGDKLTPDEAQPADQPDYEFHYRQLLEKYEALQSASKPAAWVWLKDDELIAAYRRGRDSVPKPTNGWCFVDDHIPGLREVQREVLYTLREKNGGAA